MGIPVAGRHEAVQRTCRPTKAGPPKPGYHGSHVIKANRLSVMVELQADCFSGVWAFHAQESFGSIGSGDIDEALNAANQIGDDTLQRNAGQAVVPDSFTHGSSQQRLRWFRVGFEAGDPASCYTFNVARL